MQSDDHRDTVSSGRTTQPGNGQNNDTSGPTRPSCHSADPVIEQPHRKGPLVNPTKITDARHGGQLCQIRPMGTLGEEAPSDGASSMR